MGLADRGGSSGYVGDAWGEYCETWLISNIGQELRVNAEVTGILHSVLDVDGIPGLATFASHRGLQNPDFLIGLETDSCKRLLVPVDAKFSVETAKPKQVSAEMTASLVEAEGSPVAPFVEPGGDLTDGFFLSPDYELTHQVLGGAVGILRTAVHRSQVLLLPSAPDAIYLREDVRALASDLAAIDRSSKEAGRSLATALYYIRCAFACSGAHLDITKPLLGFHDGDRYDLEAVRSALPDRAENVYSAWTVVQQWDADAEAIRAMRIAVHQAAEVGVSNKDLRAMVEAAAASARMVPPSMNRVRRNLAIWSMTEMVDRFGTIHYPVDDLAGLLTALRSAARDLQMNIPDRVRAIVQESATA